MPNQPKLLDFFCGAGGWSEGFRQQGFKVVKGVDYWRPAVLTHNHNHGLNDAPIDVLDYESCPTSKIDADFEDTEVIVGSPPCVSFSMSNKAGKADKGLGIRLIESYLRIVAYKKWKPNSALRAWYMENVPNSKNFVQKTYSFADLKLSDLAKSIKKNPKDVALNVQDNGGVLCAADYGSPQSRERFVCGEWVESGEFLAPEITHAAGQVTLGSILRSMPSPASEKSNRLVTDPNYPEIKVPLRALSDHFYDTGVYESEWESSRAAKVNHPFMGKMSFPENLDRPSRTIMATRSAGTRESLLYPSAFKGRKGDGEYRMPTIREAATLMGFPYWYQFTGSEGTKWKQIGNAVCPHMSIAVAKAIRKKMELRAAKVELNLTNSVARINDLNTFKETTFEKPPRKKPDAKFRRQPFKYGGIATALVNFDLSGRDGNWVPGSRWGAALVLGSGKDYEATMLTQADKDLIAAALAATRTGKDFMKKVESALGDKIGSTSEKQRMLIEHRDLGRLLKPTDLVAHIATLVEKEVADMPIDAAGRLATLFGRKTIPLRHLCAAYAIIKAAQDGKQAETTSPAKKKALIPA